MIDDTEVELLEALGIPVRLEFGPHNPHHDAGKCGLKLLAVIDEPDMSYSFNTGLLFKHARLPVFWYVEDSGCSCPTPFSDVHSTDDMTRVRSLDELARVLKKNEPLREEDRKAMLDAARKAGLS